MLYIFDFVAFGIVFTAVVVGIALMCKAMRPFFLSLVRAWVELLAFLELSSNLTLIFDKEAREERKWRAFLNKPLDRPEPQVDWQRFEDQVEAYFLLVGDHFAPFSPYDQLRLA